MSEFLIDENGSQIWYDAISDIKNDKENINFLIDYPNREPFYVRRHRLDGPAMISFDGTEVYSIYGMWHNEDGPARISPSGYVQWWLNDEYYLFDEWCEKTNKSPEEITFLKLKWNIL